MQVDEGRIGSGINLSGKENSQSDTNTTFLAKNKKKLTIISDILAIILAVIFAIVFWPKCAKDDCKCNNNCHPNPKVIINAAYILKKDQKTKLISTRQSWHIK